MPEGALSGPLLLLAVAGALALIARIARAVFRLALHAMEVTAASGLAEVSARRGDLTGLAERRAREERARRERRLDTLLLALWIAWLAIPPLVGWTQVGYALAAPLWLLPRRVRTSRLPTPPGQ